MGSSYQEGGVGIQLSRGEGLRSSYQEGGVGIQLEERVWDPVIKRGGLDLDQEGRVGDQLSRGEGWRSSYQEGRAGDLGRGGLEI